MPDNVNTDVNVEVIEKEKPVFGRLSAQMERYADAPRSGEGDAEHKESTAEFDYSHFTDIDEKDYAEIDKVLSENGQKDNKQLRHYIAMRNNDWKKHQRLADARFHEIETLKKVSPATNDVHDKFFNGLKEDFLGTYEHYKDELGLPDINTVTQQLRTGGDLQSRVAHFQENELIPQIEKKYGLEEGTFIYDASEAYDAKKKTPSYEYRIATEAKEKELKNEVADMDVRQKDAFNKIISARDEQLKKIRDTYFSVKVNDDKEKETDEYKTKAAEAEAAFTAKLAQLDSMSEKMKAGDFSPESNPFAIWNLFRGVFFDDILKKEISDAVNSVHQAYQKRGMFLKGKELPTDASKLGSGGINLNGEPQIGKFVSPLSRQINRYSN